ncbi:MAG: pilus assembly protein [Rhizobiales bacterium]|nr:pilus assembly protein [Hyphomicrobiales bacterium]
MIGMISSKSIRDALAAFRRDRGGNVAITFALVLIPIVVSVGAAIDYSRANSVKAHLQAATDAAVLYITGGPYANDDQRISAGKKSFHGNYHRPEAPATPTVTIGRDTVTVSATANVKTSMLGLVGIHSMSIGTTSVSRITGGSSACVLALQTMNDGIFVHGNASLKSNCGLYANSTSNNAIDFDGDSVTTASSICVVGNYTKDSQAKVSPTPKTRCRVMSDPLASLPVPTNASASCTNNGYKVDGKTTKTLNPGVYCGGIDIGSSAKVTFSPGVYIIRDGHFKIGSSAQVTGQNVFFYLTGQDANFDMGSASQINFTAPKSGTYKGVIFFQSRTANTPYNKFGSSSTSVLQGAVYIPNGTVEINCKGSVGASADYTVWVVKRLQIDSNARLQVTNNYAGSTTPLADGLSAMVYGNRPILVR